MILGLLEKLDSAYNHIENIDHLSGFLLHENQNETYLQKLSVYCPGCTLNSEFNSEKV